MVRWLRPVRLTLLFISCLYCLDAIRELRTAYHFGQYNYTAISFAAFNLGARASVCCTKKHADKMVCGNISDVYMKIFGVNTRTLSLLCSGHDPSTSKYKGARQLQYHVIPVGASDTSYQAQIMYPEYGAIVFNHLKIELLTNVSLYDQLVLKIAGLPDTVVPSTMQTIESQDDSVEPGSWFYSVTPLSTQSGRDLYGIPSVGYMEFTPNETEIHKMRRFVNRTISIERESSTISKASTSSAKPSMICFFSGNAIDGLRSVWLQQSEFMDSNRFAFTWLLAAETTTKQSKYTLRSALRNLTNFNWNVFVQDTAGFALQLNDLHEIPNDGSPAAVHMWAGNTTNLYLYAHQRWLVANSDIDAMSPPWCKRMYENMRHSLLSAGCKVAVYGNDRHFGSNVVIIDTARSLNITSVGELSNHFVHLLTVPDVLVAPSEFAAHHPSIQELMLSWKNASADSNATIKTTNTSVQVVVISPSVNTDTLRPLKLEERSSADLQQKIYRHPGCVVTGEAPINHSPCIVIGFLARLSKGTQIFILYNLSMAFTSKYVRFYYYSREKSRSIPSDGLQDPATPPVRAVHYHRRRSTTVPLGEPRRKTGYHLGSAFYRLGQRCRPAGIISRIRHCGEPFPLARDFLHCEH